MKTSKTTDLFDLLPHLCPDEVFWQLGQLPEVIARSRGLSLTAGHMEGSREIPGPFFGLGVQDQGLGLDLSEGYVHFLGPLVHVGLRCVRPSGQKHRIHINRASIPVCKEIYLSGKIDISSVRVGEHLWSRVGEHLWSHAQADTVPTRSLKNWMDEKHERNNKGPQ